MATAAKKTDSKSAPARRAQLTPQAAGDPVAAAAEALMAGKPSNGAEIVQEAKEAGEEIVNVKVPQAFRLTLDSHHEIAYDAHTAKMPKAHAEHWYAKANGVEIV